MTPNGRPESKRYDAEYFQRWYHDPARRVIAPAAVARKVHLAMGVAEMLLDRPIKRVLDVGCGEGAWRAHLRRARATVEYDGVESSEYAVARYGRSRNIRAGSFGTLGALALEGSYDLIVVCDVLQYIPDRELASGLAAIAALLGGVVYLEAYTTDDALDGDHAEWHHRSPEQYRRAFRRAGLHAVGMHCYVGEALLGATVTLERGHP
ncbi:MAG: class I SAM-dependent DNA methyltransferase [Gemmatimonadaceae bacterium]